MRRIPESDPGRQLAGLEQRLKDPDRVKAKVITAIAERGRTVEDALTTVQDAIRYTFQYPAPEYAAGVRTDTARLTSAGFELLQRQNAWTHDQYKAITSRWCDPGTGQPFEVQFHTRASFRARQLTHEVYQRLQDPSTSRAEVHELRRILRELYSKVPVPAGATEIPDYPTWTGTVYYAMADDRRRER
jgi:hypothetical protein